MVPRFRSRGLNLRPVNRIKHVVDKQAGVVLATVDTTNLINAVDAPVIANTSEVQTGSTVNGIYLKCEVTRTGTTSDVLANVYMNIGKNPGGNVTLPNPNAVGASDNKRFVIHQEMVMLQGFNASNPRTLFNGVITIPRGYRRFAPDDRLELSILSPGVPINLCIQCHYKEFR